MGTVQSYSVEPSWFGFSVRWCLLGGPESLKLLGSIRIYWSQICFGWSFPTGSDWEKSHSTGAIYFGKEGWLVSPKSLGLTNPCRHSEDFEVIVQDWIILSCFPATKMMSSHTAQVSFQKFQKSCTEIPWPSWGLIFRLAFPFSPKTAPCFMAWNRLVCPGNHGGKVGGVSAKYFMSKLGVCW